MDDLMHALRTSVRAGALGYSLRSGFLLLVSLPRALRPSFKKAVRHALCSRDPISFARFFASFVFIWKLSYSRLCKSRKQSKLWGFVSGSLAGLSLLSLSSKRRVPIAQQTLVRGLQASYTALSSRKLIHIPHGDAIIFMLASAQIMYGYAMNKNSLPRGFYDFMIKTAPTKPEVLELNNAVVRGRGPDALELLPCETLHSDNPSCVNNTFLAAKKVFQQIFPVYLALTLAPAAALRIRYTLRHPVLVLLKSVKNTMRSSLFLSVFVSGYSGLVCLHRNIALFFGSGILAKDHKLLYFVWGLFASLSIFIENRKRRSELALYVLPRGIEAFWKTLANRRIVRPIPGAEIAMFSLGTGLIMSFFEGERENLSSMIDGLLYRFDRAIEDPGKGKDERKTESLSFQDTKT